MIETVLSDAPLGLDADFPEKVWVYGCHEKTYSMATGFFRGELFVIASFSALEISRAVDPRAPGIKPYHAPFAIEPDALLRIVAKGRNDAGKHCPGYEVKGVVLCDESRMEIARRYCR